MDDINALIASAIPVQPPDDWFNNPGLSAPTAIKVTPDGRVYGHVASWDTDHIGMPFGTRPPKNKSGYAYFKTGELLTSSGALVPVGQLTLAGGHAGLEATAAQAARHYDDTKSAVADVAVGEDQHGIWVAGALRSDATPEQIRALRASAPSGDWRMINGRLEMVAVCQVNVPGFPIPRALAAGGARLSLVAGGSTVLLAQVLAEQEFEIRLQRLEELAAEQQREKLALVASAAKTRVEAARQQSLARVAELARLRVRDPERYRQLTALTAASPSQAKRDKAADDGHALPDGSFPINTEEDLRNAVQAYGRAKDKDAAKAHIKKRARALGNTDLLPEDWKTASASDEVDDDGDAEDYAIVTAAGNFDHLDKDFLSRKAEEQPRDSNGRFVQTGAFLRWKTPGKEGYEFGQVLGRQIDADGTIEVRLADSNTIVRRRPNEVEVIRAILPADQVDNKDDRGIPFKKKEGRKTPASPSGPGSSIPGTDPGIVDSPVVDPNAENPIPKVGDRVASTADGTELGTVTKADDPLAIEVTDDGGIVTVYDTGEIVVVVPSGTQPGPSPAAAPAPAVAV